MSLDRVLRWLVISLLSAVGLVLVSQPAFAAKVRHGKAPFLVMGPRATPLSNGVAPNFGLFTCQIVGLSPGVTCYDPYQMRTAYHVDTLINSGYTGAGHTIVIIDAFQSPTLTSDLDGFTTFYGLPPRSGFFTQIAPDGLTPFDPTNDDQVSWSGEITLDVEWSHAIAPGANVVLVLAKSDQDADILSALKYAVDNNLGDVISMSFGENESCEGAAGIAGYHDVFVAATQKNITLFASAGDDGAAQPTCDGSDLVIAASHPATDPLVTAVGGTTLTAARYCEASLGCNPATNPAPGTYQNEVVWNEFDDDIGATGGGFSVIFDEPSWQKSQIKDGKSRAVPDVSYDAAVLHGVLTFYQGQVFLFGGTSAGSPQWAAITVIANQRAGHRLGFINSALYQTYKSKKSYPVSFNDITVGDNVVPGLSGFSAASGWDPTTGIGSPIAANMVDILIGNVSPGDGQSAISSTKFSATKGPSTKGPKQPH